MPPTIRNLNVGFTLPKDLSRKRAKINNVNPGRRRGFTLPLHDQSINDFSAKKVINDARTTFTSLLVRYTGISYNRVSEINLNKLFFDSNVSHWTIISGEDRDVFEIMIDPGRKAARFGPSMFLTADAWYSVTNNDIDVLIRAAKHWYDHGNEHWHDHGKIKKCLESVPDLLSYILEAAKISGKLNGYELTNRGSDYDDNRYIGWKAITDSGQFMVTVRLSNYTGHVFDQASRMRCGTTINLLNVADSIRRIVCGTIVSNIVDDEDDFDDCLSDSDYENMINRIQELLEQLFDDKVIVNNVTKVYDHTFLQHNFFQDDVCEDETWEIDVHYNDDDIIDTRCIRYFMSITDSSGHDAINLLRCDMHHDKISRHCFDDDLIKQLRMCV